MIYDMKLYDQKKTDIIIKIIDCYPRMFCDIIINKGMHGPMLLTYDDLDRMCGRSVAERHDTISMV